MSNSLRPHGLQHTRLLCLSLSPGVCSNLHPLSQWCYLNILSSATPSSFCSQSFPASGSFPMSQLFTSSGQGIGASASVLPMNIHGWFPLGLTGLISSQCKRLWRVFQYHNLKKKTSILHCSAFFMDQISHLHMTTGKTIALTRQIFGSTVVSLLFNSLSGFVIASLPRSKHLLISWLQSLCAVIMEPKRMKSVTASTFSPSFAIKWWDWMPWS